tara:strand:- start:671 stop:1279 length:609 start_codon:yes stop_codon:yes gene_type:complete
MRFWGRKKEEKKKFDYSDETKEVFAERDAFYSEMRQKMGGDAPNPELADQPGTEQPKPGTEDLNDLLGGSEGFDPYVDKEQAGPDTTQSVPAPSPQSARSPEFVCTSCSKTFQEKWGKCPSCGGTMEKAESSAPSEPPSVSPSETEPATPLPPSTPDTGDPLDDLLGDFATSDSSTPSPDENSGNRKRVRKVKKVKRPRKSP